MDGWDTFHLVIYLIDRLTRVAWLESNPFYSIRFHLISHMGVADEGVVVVKCYCAGSCGRVDN